MDIAELSFLESAASITVEQINKSVRAYICAYICKMMLKPAKSDENSFKLPYPLAPFEF